MEALDKDQIKAMQSPLNPAIDKELYSTDYTISSVKREVPILSECLFQAMQNTKFSQESVQALADQIKSYSNQIQILEGQIKNLKNRIKSHEVAKKSMDENLRIKRENEKIFKNLLKQLKELEARAQ